MTVLTQRRRKGSNGNGSSLPSLVDDFFSDRFFGPGLFSLENPFRGTVSEIPSANIIENQDRYVVELDAPGFKKDDFKIDLENGTLTVSSEKEEEKKEEEKDYKRREFSYSSFSRSFNLPENVLEDKINAKYNDGLLEISIPKKEVTVSKPKKAIKVS